MPAPTPRRRDALGVELTGDLAEGDGGGLPERLDMRSIVCRPCRVADAWLGEGQVRDVAELLRPYPSEAMRAYPVSTAVNSPKNDTPECIETAA